MKAAPASRTADSDLFRPNPTADEITTAILAYLGRHGYEAWSLG